ncbi:VOC family protein [Bacillus sp. FJAT-49732]|uniref:VOC family protein n=1 Tax=Lederbergia citrisecunda TaxID=2833583 RepID=A0A942TLD7_9BACI|nr:VOC family protein [Lederbergia citrisecunda]MBS4198142.1 VOC family protein [Lederbergia citrisecunda]
MEKVEQEIYLKNFLQVRLVSDFNKSKMYYQNILGFSVDGWGHAERGNNLGFILQQAKHPGDVRPNAKPDNIQWEGKNSGWDSYFYSNFEGVGKLYEEFKSKGAIIAYGPKIETMGNGQWKEFAVKDLDGYVMVFGGSD